MTRFLPWKARDSFWPHERCRLCRRVCQEMRRNPPQATRRVHPALKLIGEREDAGAGAPGKAVHGKLPFFLPPLDRTFVTVEEAGNLFPRIQTTIWRFYFLDRRHGTQCPEMSCYVPCRKTGKCSEYSHNRERSASCVSQAWLNIGLRNDLSAMMWILLSHQGDNLSTQKWCRAAEPAAIPRAEPPPSTD